MTLRLLTTDLTCLHVHYWQEAGVKINQGSPPSCHTSGLYGYICRFPDRKTSKSQFLANIPPTIHEPTPCPIFTKFYVICTLQICVLYQFGANRFLTTQQQQPFYGRLSGTTHVSRYQKKHSPTHHPDHHPFFISFFHLPRSITSSLFKLRAWQSFCTTSCHVLFGLPLGLKPSTSYSIHFFTQSVSSFHCTCLYHRNLFCCSINIISSSSQSKLEAMRKCKPPPRHVLPVPLSGESMNERLLTTFHISQQ